MATMEKILEQARITLSNAASDPQLLTSLSAYGYGSEKLQEGMALYELARVSVQAQNNARFNKAKTQQAFQKTCKLAQVHYRNDLNIARIALKDHADAQVLLQLNSKSGKTFAARHAQAREFYFGLRNKPELQPLVEGAGLTIERINRGIQYLETIDAVRLQQHNESGSVKDTKQERNAAFQALAGWMATFRTIARVAFADQPAKMIRLGLTSTPHKTKKPEIKLPVPPAAQEMQSMSASLQA